jgi:hypothetical protein
MFAYLFAEAIKDFIQQMAPGWEFDGSRFIKREDKR